MSLAIHPGGSAGGPADRAVGRNDSVRVLVVDDHALVAAVLVGTFAGTGMEARALTPSTEAEVLDAAADLAADVVLLDLVLRGTGVSAPALIAPLRDQGASVVAFTGSTDRLLLATAVEEGVSAIVHKADPLEDLVLCIRRCARGEQVMAMTRRAELLDGLRRHRVEQRQALAPFGALTHREAAVLACLMRGEAAETIANGSFVSLATIRSQIRGVLTKLGVNSQLAAVAMAHRSGWCPPGHT